MRPVFLVGTFVALVAALTLLWNHRFERIPGMPAWDLETLRRGTPEVPGVMWKGSPTDSVLRLQVDQRHPRVAMRLAIPNAPVVEGLMLKFRIRGYDLTPGREEWETGRLMIEWHPAEHGELEKEPVSGVKLNEDSGMVSLVAIPSTGRAVPAIVLEHLGVAGGFDISDVKIIPVRETGLWTSGRFVLLGLSFVWVVACVRSWQKIAYWRAAAAAVVFLLMFAQFVIPGPWKTQSSMFVSEFRLGDDSRKQAASPDANTVKHSSFPTGAIEPSGKIIVQGGLALHLKIMLKQFRILLHIALLAAPTFVLALLLGRRDALRLAVMISLLIEGAQIVLGYGFDWQDVVDLAFDALGIGLALWVYVIVFKFFGLPVTMSQNRGLA